MRHVAVIFGLSLPFIHPSAFRPPVAIVTLDRLLPGRDQPFR